MMPAAAIALACRSATLVSSGSVLTVESPCSCRYFEIASAMSSACASVAAIAITTASQTAFIFPLPIPRNQQNPSGADKADMRQTAPGFALFGRDAGGADQISPGIDLPLEKAGSIGQCAHIGFVSQAAQPLVHVRPGGNLVHRRIQPGANLGRRLRGREPADPAVDAEAGQTELIEGRNIGGRRSAPRARHRQHPGRALFRRAMELDAPRAA